MRDHRQVGEALGHVDLAELHVLTLRVLVEEPGVGRARLDAPGLDLRERAFLVAAEHLFHADSRPLERHEGDRVGHEGVGGGEGHALAFQLVQVLDRAVRGHRDDRPDRLSRPAGDHLEAEAVEFRLKIVVGEHEVEFAAGHH